MALEILLPVVAALSAHPAPIVQEPEPAAWIGISLTESEEHGLEVTSVVPDSPAERAGFQAGDRLVRAGERGLGSFDELMDVLSGRWPGTKLGVVVQRDFEVVFNEDQRAGERPLLGVDLNSRSGDPREITGVSAGYPARNAGLRAGDVVLAIGGESVDSYDDILDAMGALAGSDATSVTVRRSLSVTLGSRPGSAASVAPEVARPRRVVPHLEVEPRGRVVVPRPAPRGDLHAELRDLADELKELRAEIAALREELESLQRGRGR